MRGHADIAIIASLVRKVAPRRPLPRAVPSSRAPIRQPREWLAPPGRWVVLT